MPLPFLAIPVLHSSEAWIAYAGSGYVANTLSATWIGSFILGNATWLASTGLVSAAGVAAASGALASLGTTAAAGLGTALTAAGLGGVASWMGIAPAATFLGLTAAGWAVAGAKGCSHRGGVRYGVHSPLHEKINEERAKDECEPITVWQLVAEIRNYEEAAVRQVLQRLAERGAAIVFGDEDGKVWITGEEYSISKLRYRVNKDGSEDIGYYTCLRRFVRVYLVKSDDDPSGIDPLPV